MALLDSLAGELLGPKSTKELSKNIEASPEQVRQAVTAAIPLLVSGMFQNSGTEEGAKSLSKALDQHAPNAKRSTSAMLKEADAEDGRKIVAHVLGNQESTVTKGISKASGLSQGQTLQLLSLLAPVVLSLVGNFKQEEQPAQTEQTVQPLQAQSASSGLTGLLGSALLGSSFQQVQPAQQSGLNLSSLAGALLGGSSQQTAAAAPAAGAGAGSLLSSLFGGQPAAQPQQAQQAQQSEGGLNLSGLLLSLLK